MSNLKCPFCNKPLQPTFRQSDEYWCENYDCLGTNIEWVGSKKLWQSLINERQHATDCQDLFIEAIAQKLETEAELERTRKALDAAVKRFGYIKNNYKIWTPDRDEQMIAQAANGLDEIKTALEQKD